MPTLGAAGSRKAPDTKKYNKCPAKFEMVDPPGLLFEDLSVIFVSWGVNGHAYGIVYFGDLVSEVSSLCGRASMAA